MSNSLFAPKRTGLKSVPLLAGLGLLIFAAQLMWAQTETVLYSFHEMTDGAYPYDSLVRDAKGNLYGTTNGGGTYYWGTVFEVTKKGTGKLLYSFTGGTDGGQPIAGLVLDKQGNLYGTTPFGGISPETNGAGVVFKVTPDRSETVLYTFSGGLDGGNPYGGMVQDKDGNLYGTTANGGAYSWGTVFKVTPTGEETVLHSFTGLDGGNPYGGLIRDAKGNLYGTTFHGGIGFGAVFEITSTGTEKDLYNFTGGTDGGNPIAGLVRDAKGNLYGTTQRGGAFGQGTVFKLTKKDVPTVLYSFTGGADGGFPDDSLVLDKQGNLYGTTLRGGVFGGYCAANGGEGCGVVFEVSPVGTETVLHTFTGPPDGSSPTGGLIRDSKGNLYGTTTFGGDPNCDGGNCGVVFKIVP